MATRIFFGEANLSSFSRNRLNPSSELANDLGDDTGDVLVFGDVDAAEQSNGFGWD